MTVSEMVDAVASDQEAIGSQCEDTRKRVLRMGKILTALQKEQKKEQEKAKARGEQPQAWKEWCEEQKVSRGHFPAYEQTRRYTLVARYPKAYESGMSIKEAYKQAGKWKKNGGNPPPKEKTVIKSRPLITIGAAAAKLERKMDDLAQHNIAELATTQKWSSDEVAGAKDAVTLLRQACNLFLSKLNELQESNA